LSDRWAEGVDWPVSMTSQDGRCPEDLWNLVHYRDAGTTHRGLAGWERGRVFEFSEPEVSAATLAP
jgi:hypothetical protein